MAAGKVAAGFPRYGFQITLPNGEVSWATGSVAIDTAGNYVAPGSGGSGGGSVPTGVAGTPNQAVVTVQGITNGTSLPVTFSNTSLAVSQFGFWDVRNITGTVSLPTGAATSALQTAGNTSLASVVSLLTSPHVASGVALDASIQAIQSDPGVDANNLVGVQGAVGMTPLQVAGSFALGASENHLGKVSPEYVEVTVTPTVTSGSAYAVGNVIGGLMTLAGMARLAAGGGAVDHMIINCKSSSSMGPVDVVLFKDNPTSSTITDKAAFALAVADAGKVAGVIHLTDIVDFGTPCMVQAVNQAFGYKLATGTSAYAVIIAATGTTPTFASTTDIIFTVGAYPL